MRKPIVAVAVLFALLGKGEAQIGSADPLAARSFSGQFVAYPSRSPFPSRFAQGNADAIPADPALLAVSCERIKQALWRMLDTKGASKDKIYLHLRPSHSAQEPATIVVQRVLNQWAYHVDVPDALEQTLFVRTITQAVLMELANRNSDQQSADLPLWLAEGFTQELLATEKKELLLPVYAAKQSGSVIKRLTIDERLQNPLDQARKILNQRAPLTFEQLSWPAPEQLSGDGIPVFRSSAQLFVRQLLQFKNGPACMRSMLEYLPHRRNWQFALLDGFQSHFGGLLEVEKWWALQLVQFTGRDLMQAWTPEESWNKLDQIVRFAVESRSSVTEMPSRTEVTLQTVIRDWNGVQQQSTLQKKSQELDLLRPRVAQSLVSVVDDYREVIGTYLQKQNFSGSFFWFKKQTGPIRNRLAETVIRDLDALDEKRRAMNPNSRLTLSSSPTALPVTP
jgi:hypothetical protein